MAQSITHPSPNFTKTKYNRLSDEFHAIFPQEQAEQILSIISRVVQFNPSGTAYNKMRINSKMQETGLTSYELFQKSYYEANKEKFVERNAKNYRKRMDARKALEEGKSENN